MSLSLFHLLHLHFGNKSHLNGGLNAKLNNLSSDFGSQQVPTLLTVHLFMTVKFSRISQNSVITNHQ